MSANSHQPGWNIVSALLCLTFVHLLQHKLLLSCHLACQVDLGVSRCPSVYKIPVHSWHLFHCSTFYMWCPHLKLNLSSQQMPTCICYMIDTKRDHKMVPEVFAQHKTMQSSWFKGFYMKFSFCKFDRNSLRKHTSSLGEHTSSLCSMPVNLLCW